MRPIKARAQDEKILAILTLRRHMMPSRVARTLGVTREKVIKVCADIKDADVKAGTKGNVETLYEILLHYPHR
jgi:hypothetical protein